MEDKLISTKKSLTLLVCVISLVSCELKEETSPKLAIDASDKYCQMDYIGDSHTFKFKLTNEGKKVLKILNIKKSCGCVSFDIPKREIQPGKSELLSITVSQSRYGLASQWILITTNETNEKALHRLVMTTEITPKFVFTPNKIIEELYPEEISRRIINVAIHVDAKVVSIDKTADWITSLVDNIESSNQIIVDFSSRSIKHGEYKDSIIVSTSLEKEKKFIIPVFFRVKSEVSVIPDLLFLGNIKRNENNKSRFIKVSVRGKVPTQMHIEIFPKDLFSYKVGNESDCSKIYVCPTDAVFTKGKTNGELKIKIDGYEDIKIPISGFVQLRD